MQGLVMKTFTRCSRNSLHPRRLTDFQLFLSVNCSTVARKVERLYPVTNRTYSKEMCFSLRGLECHLIRPHMLCKGNAPNTPTCSPGMPHQACFRLPTGMLSLSLSFPFSPSPPCVHIRTRTHALCIFSLSLIFFHFSPS